MNRITTSGLLGRLRGRPGERQRGFAEAGVAVTGAALVLGAALGSGVASTVVSMSDGVTWLADDETGQIVQVNPGTGRAERRLQVGLPGSSLQVSQQEGRLVVTDATTGTMTSIDLATLLAGGQRRSDEPARVLVGGGQVYLVTPGTGVVRAVDPLTLQDLGAPYRAGTALADAVVDARGTVWVVTTAGDVRSVTWLPDGERFEAGDPRPVRGAGAGTRLLPHERGVTVFAPDGGAVLQVGVGRDLAVAVPALTGEVLPATSAPTDLAPAGVPGRSAVVMLAGDRLLEVGVGDLGCRRPGRPAVFAGLVYVPCTGAGRVLVLRADGTRARPDVVVAGGRDPRLLVDDGRLVVQSEDGASAVVVEADGSTRVIDTGRADAAVHDPRDGGAAAVAAPPPARPSTPQRPDAPRGGPWAGDPRDLTVPPVAPGVELPTPEPSGREAGGPTPAVPVDPTPGAPGTDPTARPTARPTSTATPGARPTATARPTGTPRPTSTPTRAATPTPGPAPDAPTGVVATPGEQRLDGLTDVQVAWRPVTPAPDAYVVRAVHGDRLGLLAHPVDVEVAGTGATTATMVGGQCRTDYTFEVVAVAGGVESAPGASARVRTGPCVGPQAPLAAPTGVTATANADGTVTVTWTAASGDVDSYLVGPVGGSTTSVDDGTTSVVLRDVPAGQGVRFVVQSVRGSETVASAPSAAVTVAGPPGAPSGVAISARSSTGTSHELTLVWDAAPANGSPVTAYDVRWNGAGLGGSTTVAVTSATIGFDCTGTPLCEQGGTLTVTVTARNAAGAGPAATHAVAFEAYVGMPAEGDVVVRGLRAGTPGRNDPGVPMYATLAPPASWVENAGTCTLVVSRGEAPSTGIGCVAGEVYLGSFDGGGGTVSVAVRAGTGVTSAAVTDTVPDRREWAYCDLVTTICTEPVGLSDPDVVVVPLPWTPRLPVAPERPPLAATGVGLLLAAGVLHGRRRRAAAVGHEHGTAPDAEGRAGGAARTATGAPREGAG